MSRVPIILSVLVCWVITAAAFVCATPAATPDLPEIHRYRLKNIQRAELPGDRFEFNVRFTAFFDLKNVDLQIEKHEEIEFDEKPHSFKGKLKKGETVTWHLKGTLTKMRILEDGDEFHPVIRLVGEYKYPYKAALKALKSMYAGEKGSDKFFYDEAAKEFKRTYKKGQKVNVHRFWRA